jgi:hypothetical protein
MIDWFWLGYTLDSPQYRLTAIKKHRMTSL